MFRQISLILLLAIICPFSGVLLSSAGAQSASGVWSSKFPSPPGANGAVHAMTLYGTNLIVAGQFTKIDGVSARGLAKYDGQTWSEFGGGAHFSDGNYDAVVFTLLSDGADLYVGGQFDRVGAVAMPSLARWTGDHWESLSSGVSHVATRAAIVYALHKEGTNLYVGGSFTKAGGIDARNIAQWDGERWYPLGDGAFMPTDIEVPQSSPHGRVNAIASDGTNVFVGGFFFRAGTSGATNLAKWNGSAWQQIGNTSEGIQQYIWEGEPVSGFVNGLAWHDNALYVAGDFTKVGGLAITNLARWNGSTWDAPISANGAINTVLKEDGDLYVTGQFSETTINAAPLTPINLLRLHEGQWSMIPTQLGQWEGINAVKNFNGSFFIGGTFTRLRSVSAGNIARRTLLGWQSVGLGAGNSLNSSAQSIASEGTNIYVTGQFTVAGTHDAAYSVARWNGTDWTRLPQPAPHVFPSEIAVLGSKLYVAGRFTIPDLAATSVVAWDGERWNSAGNPDADFLFDGRLLAVQTNLYGSFTNGTKWWDGQQWHHVPWGVPTTWIERLGTDGTNVFIARNSFFARVPIARWDGASIFEYPPANLGTVSAIGAAGTNVLVAGADSDYTARLLAWNGSDWIDQSIQPTNAFISTIAALEGKLIVAGVFTNIGGVPITSIAQWDGATWRALDGGLRLRGRPALIWDLAVSGPRLYIAGEFDQAGPNTSGNIALWHQATDISLTLLPNQLNQLHITGGAGDHIQIEGSDSLQTWTRLTSFTLPTSTITATDPTITTTTNRFYRARILEP